MAIKKYQYALTLVFLGMTLVGAIGLNITPADIIRETHEAMTSDGVSISFNIYYKSTIPANRPVIVIGHGVIVNKEMMTNYAMELAARDFIVANLDWRGHGHSGGTLVNSRLVLDLEAVIASIPALASSANMSALGLIGYSMGGSPTFNYAVNHSTVKAWIGVGTSPNGDISNMTNPRNILLVCGDLDEAFSIARLKTEMINLTGVATENDVQFNHLYGNMNNGTARQIDVVPFADHISVPWDQRFISSTTDWIVRTFDGVVPDQTFMVYHERLILFITGLVGLVGMLYGVSLLLSRARRLTKEPESSKEQDLSVPANDADISGKRLVGLYYAWTLLLIPTAIIPGLTFFLPLFLTSFLVTLVGCLSINLYIFSWRYLKKKGISLGRIIKADLAGGKTWGLSISITAIFIAGFYPMVGLNYLGSMPPVGRLPYVAIYGLIMFFSYLSYSIFTEKIMDSYLERHMTFKNEKTRYVVKSLVTFVLIYSWFFIIIILLCALMGSMFLAIILILMVPIFLFGSFAGIYLQRLTRSSLPNVLLQSVLFTLLIVTLSPMGSLLGMFMH